MGFKSSMKVHNYRLFPSYIRDVLYWQLRDTTFNAVIEKSVYCQYNMNMLIQYQSRHRKNFFWFEMQAMRISLNITLIFQRPLLTCLRSQMKHLILLLDAETGNGFTISG